MNIDPFNGLAGKRGPRRSYVENQPLAVRRPGIDIGKLMMAGSKSDLFHGGILTSQTKSKGDIIA
jgi:hypothetical protein